MEQYFTPRKLDLVTLRKCLDKYSLDEIFIRVVGSMGGETKVNEKLNGRKLNFRKDNSGLKFYIDTKEVISFPLVSVGTREKDGFSVAYERVYPDGRLVFLSTGIDPYDPTLPEPQRSKLVHIIDNHFVNIFFNGRINLKFHSWYQKPHWKYWEVI